MPFSYIVAPRVLKREFSLLSHSRRNSHRLLRAALESAFDPLQTLTHRSWHYIVA